MEEEEEEEEDKEKKKKKKRVLLMVDCGAHIWNRWRNHRKTTARKSVKPDTF
jgi:hypothetical protein